MVHGRIDFVLEGVGEAWRQAHQVKVHLSGRAKLPGGGKDGRVGAQGYVGDTAKDGALALPQDHVELAELVLEVLHGALGLAPAGRRGNQRAAGVLRIITFLLLLLLLQRLDGNQ